LSIQAETGVPPEMIVAIIGVESYFGRHTGKYRVIDALATLGFDYPPRAKFFRGELGQAFLLARENDLDISKLLGSYAGAIGPPQFIPSSYRNYAVDGDGDGVVDLFNNWDDILTSVANYFKVHKWRSSEAVATQASLRDVSMDLPLYKSLKPRDTVASLSEQGVLFSTEQASGRAAKLFEMDAEEGPEYWVGFHNFYVITRYNHSSMYALAAFQLGQSIASEVNKE
ncbi:MAG: lytic murein transglycosylase, partial [Gammaproteobacteria bacterium]